MSDRQSFSTNGSYVVVEEATTSLSRQGAASKNEPTKNRLRFVLSKVRAQDWATALLYLPCDIAGWIVLYGFVGYMRRDAFFVSPFEFVLADLVTVGVLAQALYIIGGYNRDTEMRSLTYFTEHILAVIAAAVISSFLLYSAATFDATIKPSRGVLLVSFALFLPVSLAYRRLFRGRIAVSTAQRVFLVIGSGELAVDFYESYKQSTNRQQLEFVDDDPARVGTTIAGENSPVVQNGIAEKLARLDRRHSGVIIAESIDRLDIRLIQKLVQTQFQQTRVYTLESFNETQWRRVPLHTIDPVWPLQMGFQLARISPYHYLKRLFDVVLSGLLLAVSLPMLVLLTCLVWLTSGRPAIFRQVRVGREGERFTAYKFRTMVMGDGGESEDIYTRHNDPRVTPLGRWLRKLRLDELPQLWNVFRGSMSLIGPRAEWIKCTERYEKEIPLYHFRHLVKPGITGWAQVNYPYGESDEDTIMKLQYDLYYIRHYSLKLDAMIVLKTVHTMLFGRGR
jgi:exopolysaccharide biosynthesis polyprenyl glycosylphosphotransferase